MTMMLCLSFSCFAEKDNKAACDLNQAAKLVSLQGQLFYDAHQTGNWQLAKLDDVFCEGSRVRLELYSRASLVLPNDIILRLDEGTVLSLNGISTNQSTLLDLAKGFIHFLSRTPKQLSITTPIANAGPEGTEFAMNVTDNHATMWVYEGAARFSNAHGELRLKPGDSAQAQVGEAPQTQIKIKPADAVNWAMYYPPLIPSLNSIDTKDQVIVKAIKDYNHGRPDISLIRLNSLPLEKQTPWILRIRASLYLTVGRLSLAQQDIDQLLTKNAKDTHALALKSIISLVQNRKKEAYKLVNIAVANTPQSAVAYTALSYVEQGRFKLKKALKAAKKVTNLTPDSAIAWARRAELEQANGLTKTSAVSAQHALSLDAKIERTQTVMGFVNLTRQKISLAINNFTNAIVLDSSSPLARLGLGLAKIRLGDLEQGRQDIEIAVVLDPNNSIIRSYLGKAYYEERRNSYAQDQFSLAKQRDPNDPTPYFYDAIRKQTVNRPVEAIEDMQKAQELNDNRAVYRSSLQLDQDAAARTANLTRMYNDVGFGQVALKEAWTSLNQDASNPSAHRFLSDAYLGRARYRSARASELLQAQLLQPINITPVQPQLTSENIGILNSTGPGSLSINEYDSLYTRNGTHVVANGIYGTNNTIASNVIGSALYNQLSLSAGQFHYQTDGFRENDDYKQDVYDAFAQYAISPEFNVQIELKQENVRSGDIATRLNQFHRENYHHALDHEIIRIGTVYKKDNVQTLIGSFMYSDLSDLNKDHDFLPPSSFPPFDVDIKTTRDYKAEGYQAELQYDLHDDNFNLKVGVGHIGLNYKTDIVTDINIEFMSMPIAHPTIQETNEDNVNHTNAYIYLNQHFLYDIQTTLGVSFDTYDDGITIKDQFNPKVGLIWKSPGFLTFRTAFFRTLKRALAAKQTIEPTQVAGFNQLYDSTNGTSAWQYAAGIDSNFSKKMYVGGELIWRDMEEPFINGSLKSRNRDEFNYSGYLYWMPFNWLGVSSEYQFEEFKSDFVINQVDPLDPRAVQTHKVPLSISFFQPDGFFAKLSSTYINQSVQSVLDLGRNPPPNSQSLGVETSEFWIFDASIGFKFPKKIGNITFELRNIGNNGFKYQSVFDAEGPQLSPFVPERQMFVKLNLFY